jgi:hypothetical protein
MNRDLIFTYVTAATDLTAESTGRRGPWTGWIWLRFLNVLDLDNESRASV